MKYFYIFGGGAIRGIAYIGALKALKELNVEAAGYAGSSVGAIFAAFKAFGYTPEEIKKIFFDFNGSLFKDFNFTLSPGDFALSKGEIFENRIRDIIEKKFYGEKFSQKGNLPVKFSDLDEDLFIFATDLNTNKRVVFSKYDTPDFEIAQAVKISASFPGLVKPFNYEEMTLVDGDLAKASPLWNTVENKRKVCLKPAPEPKKNTIFSEISKLFKKNKKSVKKPVSTRFLEFRLEGCKNGFNPKNVFEYFNIVYSSFSNFCSEAVVENYNSKDNYDCIIIDTQDVLLLDFSISEEKREELAKIGYDTVKKYFTEQLPEKRKIINEKYKAVRNSLKTLKQTVVAGDANDVRKALAELFCANIDDFDKLDVCFSNNVKKICKKIPNNLADKRIFKSKSVKNRDEISDDIEELINFATAKIEGEI